MTPAAFTDLLVTELLASGRIAPEEEPALRAELRREGSLSMIRGALNLRDNRLRLGRIGFVAFHLRRLKFREFLEALKRAALRRRRDTGTAPPLVRLARSLDRHAPPALLAREVVTV